MVLPAPALAAWAAWPPWAAPAKTSERGFFHHQEMEILREFSIWIWDFHGDFHGISRWILGFHQQNEELISKSDVQQEIFRWVCLGFYHQKIWVAGQTWGFSGYNIGISSHKVNHMLNISNQNMVIHPSDIPPVSHQDTAAAVLPGESGEVQTTLGCIPCCTCRWCIQSQVIGPSTVLLVTCSPSVCWFYPSNFELWVRPSQCHHFRPSVGQSKNHEHFNSY